MPGSRKQQVTTAPSRQSLPANLVHLFIHSQNDTPEQKPLTTTRARNVTDSTAIRVPPRHHHDNLSQLPMVSGPTVLADQRAVDGHMWQLGQALLATRVAQRLSSITHVEYRRAVVGSRHRYKNHRATMNVRMTVVC